ncbi:trigger factor [Bailinhaonella thermotolerans]|uniref:Trigger factor n=1 Tax=Bailinhaonella thermotolerans TaxID=1070861 RepID=A0A3A4B7M0_9ACTN|nr:trigger factor [Bailinhaonella thermotolerans]RJL34567.1 trigger factor [Bailinhaonella thermotolerans]
MKTAVEELTPTRVKLTVEVPFAELEPSLQAAYKKVAQQVRVPGFRPGKVPARVIEQRFGRGVVLEEAINEAVPQFYSQAVEESELFPVSQPDLEVTKIDDGKELEFTAEVDVRPAFDLPSYDDIEVTVDSAVVTNEDIDEQLDNLRDRFATLTGVDRPAQNGDFVSIDLAASINGENLEDQQAGGISYQVGGGSVLEGLDDNLVGMSAGESKTFTSVLVGGANAGEEAEITVTVNSVKEKVLPEADDEFAQTASEFDTLEELRADIAKRVEQNKKLRQVTQAREKAVQALLDKIDIPLPESAIEAEIKEREHQLGHEIENTGLSREIYLKARGTSEEELRKDFEESSRKALKTGFVLDKVVKQREIGVSQDELTEFVVNQAMRMGVAPNQLAQHLADSGQLTLAMMEVVRNKAAAAVADEARVVDTDGNEVDLKAIYAEINAQVGETVEAGDTEDAAENEAEKA